MNRLRQPGDSEYDILGVSPGATEEEIERAFHQLIDGEGYKVGVPLNRQWLRAHQIKHAHATLADPEKRRAYDESLGRASAAAPWAMTADDAATDELVLAEPKQAEPVEKEAAPVAVAPLDEESSAPIVSEPEPEPEAPEPEEEEVAGSIQDEPLEPDFAPTANDNRRASLWRAGIAAAAACGLGLVLLSAWPEWNRQLSTSDRTPGVTAQAWQAGRAGPRLAEQSVQAPGNLKVAGASGPELDAAAGDSPTSDPPGQPLELQSASEETTAPNAGQLAASNPADAQSPADTAPADTTPRLAEAAPAPAPPVAAAQAAATAPVVAESSGSVVRSPPQWVGGGPTDADNRRGRYQGTVAVQVVVEPDGRVSNCAAVRGSGNAGLDQMTCHLIRERARFTPALDAEGRPVTSQAYTTIVWGRKQRR